MNAITTAAMDVVAAVDAVRVAPGVAAEAVVVDTVAEAVLAVAVVDTADVDPTPEVALQDVTTADATAPALPLLPVATANVLALAQDQKGLPVLIEEGVAPEAVGALSLAPAPDLDHPALLALDLDLSLE